MDFFSLCGVCVLCLVCLLALRPLRGEIAQILSALCACLFVPVGLAYLKDYFSFFSSLGASTSFSAYFQLLYKAVGIAFLSSTVSSLCRDCSEPALGAKLEFCSRAMILALSLPVAKDLLEQATSML